MAKSVLGKGLAPLGRRIAPKSAAGFVREVLERSIDGVGPLPGAARAAAARLKDAGGDPERAIDAAITRHVRMAAVQGFVTNLGGLITTPIAVPANLGGLAILQTHLIATIAHLRGFALDDPRVRNAIVVCLLGEDDVNRRVRKGTLPSTPLGIATAPAHDPGLSEMLSTEITVDLMSRVGGNRLVGIVGRRVPLLGGGVAAIGDGWSTRAIGRYAARELVGRRRPTPIR